MFNRAKTLLTAVFPRSAREEAGPVWQGGAGDIVLVLEGDGIIADISASADEMIGADDSLKGRSFFDFVRREDRDGVRKALMASRVAGASHVTYTDFRLLRARRAAAPCEISFAPSQNGRSRALVRARGEAFAKLRQAKGLDPETHKVASVRDDLMADLGHDLKTPLNAIMGFAEAMREETFGPLGNEKYREYAEHIHDSGAHLVDLISAVLDAAKLEAGRYELAPTLTAPGALARACAEMVRGEAEKAGLDLVITISPDLPDAMLDEIAVKRILTNLLSNAVKFTAAGGVSLSVAKRGDAIDFTVRDTGIGMGKEALAKLGSRFTEAHQNGVRGTKGAGIGLSVAMSLAELHGGAVKIISDLGEGTTARLTLPLRLTLEEFPTPARATLDASPDDIQSQLDRVAAYRRERTAKASAA